MPKIRPRTSAGSSSWSAVWAGMATKAYSRPAPSTAITTTTAIRLMSGAIAGTASSIGPCRAAERDRHRLDDRQEHERDAHRHEADVDDEPLRDVLAVRVEEQDPHHGAQAGRPHDEEEVLRAQAQDVDREARTDGAEHADQAGR